MNVHQFLLILLARKKIILTTLLVTVALALGFSLIQAKTYKATASVLLNYKGVDPLTGLTMPGQLLPGYMATQIDIISSKNVALRVVDALHLANSPAVIEQFRDATDGKGSVRDWLADLLLKKLEIVPSRESSVVEISFKGADPAFAAAVANAFADEYQKITVQLKTDPAKKTAAYFNEQTKQLRDNLEAAQARLSKYQQEKGIVSLDNNRVDVELARLNDLSAQLVAAQAAAIEGNSRQAAAGLLGTVWNVVGERVGRMRPRPFGDGRHAQHVASADDERQQRGQRAATERGRHRAHGHGLPPYGSSVMMLGPVGKGGRCEGRGARKNKKPAKRRACAGFDGCSG